LRSSKTQASKKSSSVTFRSQNGAQRAGLKGIKRLRRCLNCPELFHARGSSHVAAALLCQFLTPLNPAHTSLGAFTVSAQSNFVGANLRPDAVAVCRGRTLGRGREHQNIRRKALQALSGIAVGIYANRSRRLRSKPDHYRDAVQHKPRCGEAHGVAQWLQDRAF